MMAKVRRLSTSRASGEWGVSIDLRREAEPHFSGWGGKSKIGRLSGEGFRFIFMRTLYFGNGMTTHQVMSHIPNPR
jgi:hypothetical protein